MTAETEPRTSTTETEPRTSTTETEPRTSAAEPGTVAFEIDRAVEAILMVAEEPQSLAALATALSRPIAVVRQSVQRLRADYDGVDGSVRRGFELREIAGGWRMYVRREYDGVVSDFVTTQNPSRLSQAALETLAVIAYKQPISRGQVASIRAVNVDSVARTLLGRGLIAEVGHDPETGAILYGTTEALLTHLGIDSLGELPLVSPLLSDGREGFHDGRL